MADKTPNAGKSTGGDDKPSQNNTPVVSDAGSSSSVPPPPPSRPSPAAAAANVPTIAATGRVVNSPITPPPPTPPSAAAAAAAVPTNAGFGRTLTSPITPRSHHIIPPPAPRIAGSGIAPPAMMMTPSRLATTTPTNAGTGNVGQSGGTTTNTPQGEQRATAASSVIMYTPGRSSRKRNRTDNEVGGSPSRPRFDGPADMMGIPPPCWVCGKQFGSWKALFGHMRSHPERQWRGVFPPPTFKIDGSPENASEGQPPHHQQQREIVLGKSGGNVKNTDNQVAIDQGESSKKSENDLASTLLELAKGCLDKISGVGTSSAQQRIVLDVDLNLAWQPIMEPEPPVTTSPPPPPPPPSSPQPQRSPTPPPPRPPSPPPKGDAAGGIPDLNRSPPQDDA